ncbi:MAG: protein-export chaperone SecB [Pseudomonadota bacterium]
MSNEDVADSNAKPAQPAGEAPAVNILAQYVKDLSFENPKAPASLRPQETSPRLNINVNVNANPASDIDFEVVLSMDATAELNNETVFAVELVYAGVFKVQNVPKEHLHPFVLIECPRLLFPFARQIMADATRNGGFPPLLIDPIDFAALYRQNIQARTAEKDPATLN